MSDIDPRPRPQFGEYATPEEQRARIRRPEVTEALDAGVAPAPVVPTSPTASTSLAAATRGPLADRIATFALLIYGLVNVIANIVQFLDFPSFAKVFAETIGADATYTNLTAGYVWGAAAAAVFGIGWALTAFLTWRRLRRGRIAFWVPLVGFVVTAALGGACLMAALAADSTYWTAIVGVLAK